MEEVEFPYKKEHVGGCREECSGKRMRDVR